MDAIMQFDFSILRFIHNHLSSPFMDKVMITVSRLTDAGFLWICIAVILLFIPKHRKTGVALLVALGIGVIFGSYILKPIFARLRPFQLDPSFSLLITAPRDFSFPSGHTLTSFAAATVFLKTHRRIGIAAMIFATIVALSRLYLYVHFFTDILGGIILGILVGYLSSWLIRYCYRKC